MLGQEAGGVSEPGISCRRLRCYSNCGVQETAGSSCAGDDSISCSTRSIIARTFQSAFKYAQQQHAANKPVTPDM